MTMNIGYENLDALFHPRSVALVGITTSNPEHWTRGFLEGYLGLDFPSQGNLYLVNPRGGTVDGFKVFQKIQDIPDTLDFVVGLVPSRSASQLVIDAAAKGAKFIHFCTAGFSEIDDEEGKKLEAELLRTARKHHVRIIGPNCLGIYCPESRMSFSALFSPESGPVGFISQSGGNANYLIRQAALRGVHFSKVISFGNACDLNESDFLEYLADDPKTKMIAMYLEGIKDGDRFLRALKYAAEKKAVVMLKGGTTPAGARAVMGHTSSLAGSRDMWESLCRQVNAIQVQNLDEMTDVLVTLTLLTAPAGRRALLFGGGGGSSVIVADTFEKRGMTLPQVPKPVINKLREFSQDAGNFFSNPIDYSQSMDQANVKRALDILMGWGEFDFIVNFMVPGQSTRAGSFSGRVFKFDHLSRPVAIVIPPAFDPAEADGIFRYINHYVVAGYPVYFSFDSAACAINLVLTYNERISFRQGLR
ncbi:MAG: CoA-binding protein [Deltaproteobacteria bacterium]|nr:CoA-binding protein [Deltaproteobacteria bacterium]